jgi:hypothetical protein
LDPLAPVYDRAPGILPMNLAVQERAAWCPGTLASPSITATNAHRSSRIMDPAGFDNPGRADGLL